MKKKHRVLKLVLVALISFISVIGSTNLSVKADSNDRISTFISMAAGKQITTEDINSMNLSEQDLRFLGVYISNFFVPFGTEMGEGTGEKDTTAQTQEDIVKALQTNLKFSDETAKSFAETLMGRSRASIKELKFAVAEKKTNDVSKMTDVPNTPVNYYTFLTVMMGGADVMAEWTLDEPEGHREKAPELNKSAKQIWQNIKDKKYEYGYFYFEENGSKKVVFDCNMSMGSITPSQAAFIKCLESLDLENGFATNFMDFTKDEMGESNSDWEEKEGSIQESDLMKMSAYGAMVNVDCFGNIIYYGANHKYVMVPGCMNPYVWQGVNTSGSDSGDPGEYYNVVNVPSLSLIDSKEDSNTLYTSIKEKGKTAVKGVKTGNLSIKVLTNQMNKMFDSDSLMIGARWYTMRLVRGSSEDSLNTGILDWLWGKGSFRGVTRKAQDGFEKAYSKSYNYYHWYENKSWDHIINDYSMNIGFPSVSFVGDVQIKTGVDMLDSFVFIDDLGTFHFDSGKEKVDYHALNVDHYIGSDSKSKQLWSSVSSDGGNGWSNRYKDIKNGKLSLPTNASDEAMVGIYTTYAFAGLYDSSSKESMQATIGKLGYRLNSEDLPSIPDKGISLSGVAVEDMQLNAIRDWTYYLMHPTEGGQYFKIWLTNKLNAFMMGWHDDMVGTNGTGSVTGTTTYRGFSGYVTSPELTDMPWSNSLLNLYNMAIPFFLILMLLTMLGAYITGILTLQKAVIGLGLFAVCVTLPPIMINGSVGVSNRFSTKLYGEKFTYWALVQHETYSDAIEKAATGDSYSNYLRTLYQTNSKAKGNQGSESVMLKWQAPKKMASLMMTGSDKSALGSNGSTLISGLLNSAYSGESYLNNSDSVYLYRSYIDISNFSRYIHRGVTTDTRATKLSLTSDLTSTWDQSLKDVVSNYGTNYESDRSLGYTNPNGDGSISGTNKNIVRVRLPMASAIVTDALADRGTIKDLKLGQYVGINQNAFNFSIPWFNNKDLDYKNEFKTDKFKPESFEGGSYTEEDYTALAAYGLMSESAFYYFSWDLYESGLSQEASSNQGYKGLLLGDDNAGFFYNTKGNGEMKDFMDMKSLFTYVIPYLRQGNDLVKEWDDVYGVSYYEGVPTEEGHENDADIKGNKELEQKYWHNLNVARLYNIYTPWVDVMYDCSYANPETINYLGEKYLVKDPLNPASYPEDRPMIFSRSEMADYGLKENQLTAVERKILECNDGMQKRMFKLLNYHNFNDVVLNTAAAMNCAFEFNTIFSESSIVGANHNIYPQAFELNDFSYDAFLRFILSNSTGESMIVDSNEAGFYQRIGANSSLTTALCLLVLDVLAMYIVPGMKMLFIFGVFAMSILVILMTAFRLDPQQKFVSRLLKSLVKPMFSFLAVTCGMSFVISKFMGDGNTAVTGSLESTIQLGDPVTTLIIMGLINAVVVFLYFKLLKGVWKDIKRSVKLVGGFMQGVFAGVGGMVASAIMPSSHRGRSGSGGGSFDGSGGGSPSRRASQRGREDISDREERRESPMDRADRHKPIKDLSSKKEKKERSSDDIDYKTSEGMGKIKDTFRGSREKNSESGSERRRFGGSNKVKRDKHGDTIK